MAKAKSKGRTKRGARAKSQAKSKSKSKAKAKSASLRKIARPGKKRKAAGPATTAKRPAAARGAAKRRPSKSKPSSRRPTRGSGRGTIGKSGEGLDGGVARREAGDPAAIGTIPAAASRPAPRKAKAQLPGEKAVADTDETFPVKPERPAPGEREPMPPEALDQRRQIVGTDDDGPGEPGQPFEDDLDDPDDSEEADAP
jgi:hypothetical protein